MGYTTLRQWLERHSIATAAAVFTYKPDTLISHVESENMRREIDYFMSCNCTKHDAELKVLIEFGYLKYTEFYVI